MVDLEQNHNLHFILVTKAADKKENIEAAIEVFTKWMDENTSSNSAKTTKTSADEKIPTVPGLGFKDKEAALKTLE